MREALAAGCEDVADIKLLEFMVTEFVRALLMRLGRRRPAAACQDVTKVERFLGLLVERADLRGFKVV
jgi:hypothetical protein